VALLEFHSVHLDEHLLHVYIENCLVLSSNSLFLIKSLSLASSLKGAARAILNELDGDKRRDYDSLVHALHNRFGSLHRSEIFRATSAACIYWELFGLVLKQFISWNMLETCSCIYSFILQILSWNLSWIIDRLTPLYSAIVLNVSLITHNVRINMKPQPYDCTEDIEEYLSQFQILSEVNGWIYNIKSLCLASSFIMPIHQ
jgi:hypothetical protein